MPPSPSTGGRYRSRTPRVGLLLLALLLVDPLIVLAAESPLLMGVFPRRNAQVTNRLFAPMADYLSGQLGREVQLVLSKDFASFWLGVEARRFDIVHLNQYHYLKSHQQHGYTVILRNKEQGESTIAGALMVRSDSGIEQVADLRGRRVIFGGGPMAMQSYIIARYLLNRGGVKEGEYQALFAKNPPNAILATYVGEAAAAGAGDKVLELPVVKRSLDTRQMRLLAIAPQLPHLPWAVRSDMAPPLQGQIQSLLAGLDSSEAGRAILAQAQLDGLVPTVDSDYNTHRQIILEVLGEAY